MPQIDKSQRDSRIVTIKQVNQISRNYKHNSNMLTFKTSAMILALVASCALAQAAGIKGIQRAEDSPRFAVKGPRQQQQQQQQQYLPPPPPPAPQAVPLPPPRPIAQQPIKGPGQITPVFSAARVQPIVQQVVQVPIQQQQIVQQQQEVQQQVQEQEQEPEASQQQQQQQQEEVDPNAAAQDSAPAIATPARVAPAPAAASEEEANPRPEPYAFNYAFDAGDSATSGSSQREETQDANGKVTGFYTLRGEDGRDRRVDYVADADGFRAVISTNEMGTSPKDSADVDWNAQNPSDAQLRSAESATQAARQRALLNPQPSGAGSSSSGIIAQPSKISSPRQNVAGQRDQFNPLAAQQQQQQVAVKGRPIQQQQISQLQEPFEQIRQTELNSRARKSRHAPFYLYTV